MSVFRGFYTCMKQFKLSHSIAQSQLKKQYANLLFVVVAWCMSERASSTREQDSSFINVTKKKNKKSKKSKKNRQDNPKTTNELPHSMDKREKSVYLSEIEFSGLKPAKTSKTRFKKF